MHTTAGRGRSPACPQPVDNRTHRSPAGKGCPYADGVLLFVREPGRWLRGLEMTEQPEYPDFAWREVIVNAMAHRDYSITGTAIQVRMFDDRLEVESPGGLPGIVARRHKSSNG
jgi:hypothetical protein